MTAESDDPRFAPPTANVEARAVAGPSGINFKAVARDVIIVFALTFLAGIVLGIALGAGRISASRGAIALALSNVLFSIVAYCIVGAMAKTNRFKHLMVVATVCWLLSAFNMLFLPAFTVPAWMLSSVMVLFTMGVGGGLSFLFVRAPKADATAEQVG